MSSKVWRFRCLVTFCICCLFHNFHNLQVHLHRPQTDQVGRLLLPARTEALVWSLLNSLLLDSCWSPGWRRGARLQQQQAPGCARCNTRLTCSPTSTGGFGSLKILLSLKFAWPAYAGNHWGSRWPDLLHSLACPHTHLFHVCCQKRPLTCGYLCSLYGVPGVPAVHSPALPGAVAARSSAQVPPPSCK